MKSISRSVVFWPNIDTDIERTVKRCIQCMEAQKNPPRIVNSHWTYSEQPWSRIHVDFAGPINGLSFLVVVNAHSKWPEIFLIQQTDTQSTITVLRRLFSRHGLPKTYISDNGSQFTSESFQQFCKSWCIMHIRSPPYHPQSNGQAKRFVDMFKRALRKARGEGTTDEILQTFLLSYRTTPNGAVKNDLSPAEALTGRKLCTTLDTLWPQQQRQQPSPNKKSFSLGTPVFVRNYRSGQVNWVPVIICKTKGQYLYGVQVGNQFWVRHENQIHPRYTVSNLVDSMPTIPFELPFPSPPCE